MPTIRTKYRHFVFKFTPASTVVDAYQCGDIVTFFRDKVRERYIIEDLNKRDWKCFNVKRIEESL